MLWSITAVEVNSKKSSKFTRTPTQRLFYNRLSNQDTNKHRDSSLQVNQTEANGYRKLNISCQSVSWLNAFELFLPEQAYHSRRKLGGIGDTKSDDQKPQKHGQRNHISKHETPQNATCTTIVPEL